MERIFFSRLKPVRDREGRIGLSIYAAIVSIVSNGVKAELQTEKHIFGQLEQEKSVFGNEIDQYTKYKSGLSCESCHDFRV